MTSRERVAATVRSGFPDRKPMIAWPYWKEGSDIRHFTHAGEPLQVDAGEIAVVEVTNPFGLALQRGIDLNQQLKDDPRSGNRRLGEFADEVRNLIDASFTSGADGILYRLFGARARHCTPMQYGGYYLERDRELLEHADGSGTNLLFVVGEEDVYLDFVSDLPAQAFGWDAKSSKVGCSEVRSMRSGALFSEDPESDILLEPNTAFLSRILESSLRTQDAYAV